MNVHYICDECWGSGCKWCRSHGQYFDDRGHITFPTRRKIEPVKTKPVEVVRPVFKSCNICGDPTTGRVCKACRREYY